MMGRLGQAIKTMRQLARKDSSSGESDHSGDIDLTYNLHLDSQQSRSNSTASDSPDDFEYVDVTQVRKIQSTRDTAAQAATQSEAKQSRKRLTAIGLLVTSGLTSLALGLAGGLTGNVLLLRLSAGFSGPLVGALLYGLYKITRKYITWLKEGWKKTEMENEPSPTLLDKFLRIASLLLPAIAVLVLAVLDVRSSFQFFSGVIGPNIVSGAVKILGALGLGWIVEELSVAIIAAVASASIGFVTARISAPNPTNQNQDNRQTPPSESEYKEIETYIYDPADAFRQNQQTHENSRLLTGNNFNNKRKQYPLEGISLGEAVDPDYVWVDDTESQTSQRELIPSPKMAASGLSFSRILDWLKIGPCFGVQPEEQDDCSQRSCSEPSTESLPMKDLPESTAQEGGRAGWRF